MLSKAQVKYIQSLYQKKFRDEEAKFLAEGPKIVAECCRQAASDLVAIYAIRSWLDAERNLLKNITEDRIFEVETHELEKISARSTPNQVLAVMKKASPGSPNFNNTLTLLLDTIQDPGNLGTMIRIADWFGLKQIVCSRDSAEVYNPKVIQSSMGSFLRVACLYEDLDEFLNKHAAIPLYATALDGRNIHGMGSLKEGFILIGNESKGLKQAWLDRAHERITIPKFGEAESLNAAVAAGIVLYQLTC
jgi:TrmH family RNA methyltransferase